MWECETGAIVSEGQNLGKVVCMDNDSAINLGLWVRAAEAYHEAAEICWSSK